MLEERMKYVELSYASKAPVMESAYAMHNKTALRLYDCLIPKIGSH